MMRVFTPRGYLALFALLTVLGSGVFLATAAGAQSPVARSNVIRHAVGAFEVVVTPADPEVVEAGLGLSRYTLAKTFSGALTGRGEGQMLAGGPNPETGSYVALERIVGVLDGRDGAFLMAHRGDMTKDGYTLAITVVPNSGTGALAGLEGELALTITNGVHHYDLAYSLPEP